MAVSVLTGPRARLTFDGVIVGLCKSVSVQEELTHEPIKVIDNIEVLQNEPVEYTCSCQASEVLAIRDTMEAKGFFPRKGATAAEFLFNALAQAELTMQIEDSVEGVIIARVYGVKIQGKQFAIDPRTSVARDITMVARRMVEASEAV
jgi:hypothetical protein